MVPNVCGKNCIHLWLCVQEMVRRGEILDDDMEDEFYLRRLDAGLFVLQLICYIMVEINNSGISQVRTSTHTPTLASWMILRFFLWCAISLKQNKSSICRTLQFQSYFKLPLLIQWLSSFSTLLIHFTLETWTGPVRKSQDSSNHSSKMLEWMDIIQQITAKKI